MNRSLHLIDWLKAAYPDKRVLAAFVISTASLLLAMLLLFASTAIYGFTGGGDFFYQAYWWFLGIAMLATLIGAVLLL